MMIEVFKTNVTDQEMADRLVAQIQNTFETYTASFDLEDCDRILVVKCSTGNVRPLHVVNLLSSFNLFAEVLPD